MTIRILNLRIEVTEQPGSGGYQARVYDGYDPKETTIGDVGYAKTMRGAVEIALVNYNERKIGN